MHFFISPLVATAGTVSTRQKRRSESVTLHVLTPTPAWLHRLHSLLSSPPPFSNFSDVGTHLRLCWELTSFTAQSPVFLWSVLRRQVFLREYWEQGSLSSVSPSREAMICSTDSFSFLQKLQPNVSDFSLEPLPHAPSWSPWLLASANTFFSAPVPVECCSSRTWQCSACGTLQMPETASRRLTSVPEGRLGAAVQHSGKTTASAPPQAL